MFHFPAFELTLIRLWDGEGPDNVFLIFDFAKGRASSVAVGEGCASHQCNVAHHIAGCYLFLAFRELLGRRIYKHIVISLRGPTKARRLFGPGKIERSARPLAVRKELGEIASVHIHREHCFATC